MKIRRVIMLVLRLFLFLAGAAGFTGFVIPLIKRRILNIGNAAGLTVCTVLMLYMLFMPCINTLIGKWWQKKGRKSCFEHYRLGNGCQHHTGNHYISVHDKSSIGSSSTECDGSRAWM